MTTIVQPAGGSSGPPSPAPLSRRIAPTTALRHTGTITWRNLVAIRHNPTELIDLSLQPIMFVLLFVYVFGGAFAGSTDTYLQFVLAGIITQNAMFLTMTTAVGLNTDITKGIFDRFRSLPIARSAPLAGRIVADVVRQMWSVTILLAVGAVMGFRVHTGVAGVIGAYLLLITFSLAFSWAAVLIGLTVDTVEKVQSFGFLAIFPLTFASNAFVRTDTMPGWMQAWVKVNPVTSLTDAVRGLLVSGPVAEPTVKVLLWSLGITAVFLPLALRAFRRRV